jgi:hypothetical protein
MQIRPPFQLNANQFENVPNRNIGGDSQTASNVRISGPEHNRNGDEAIRERRTRGCLSFMFSCGRKKNKKTERPPQTKIESEKEKWEKAILKKLEKILQKNVGRAAQNFSLVNIRSGEEISPTYMIEKNYGQLLISYWNDKVKYYNLFTSTSIRDADRQRYDKFKNDCDEIFRNILHSFHRQQFDVNLHRKLAVVLDKVLCNDNFRETVLSTQRQHNQNCQDRAFLGFIEICSLLDAFQTAEKFKAGEISRDHAMEKLKPGSNLDLLILIGEIISGGSIESVETVLDVLMIAAAFGIEIPASPAGISYGAYSALRMLKDGKLSYSPDGIKNIFKMLKMLEDFTKDGSVSCEGKIGEVDVRYSLAGYLGRSKEFELFMKMVSPDAAKALEEHKDVLLNMVGEVDEKLESSALTDNDYMTLVNTLKRVGNNLEIAEKKHFAENFQTGKSNPFDFNAWLSKNDEGVIEKIRSIKVDDNNLSSTFPVRIEASNRNIMTSSHKYPAQHQGDTCESGLDESIEDIDF